MNLKPTYSKPGLMLTLYSEDGRALMHHPDPDVLRQSVLYVNDNETPILPKGSKDEEDCGKPDTSPG